MDYLARVFAMLGDRSSRSPAPGSWEGIEQALGFSLPGDYKKIIDRYAPVRLNAHLYLHHPGTERWNLKDWVLSTIQAWSEVDEWDDFDEGDDPRLFFGASEVRFGVRDGLTPILNSDRGETIFFSPRSGERPEAIFVEGGDGDFHHYPLSFSEWLYRHLIGEHMTGPADGIFYAGPVKFISLPMASGDPEIVWYGPERGM
ncbi:SMI1/KNR4 family protein [Streptomyces sp. NPDC004838]